MIAVNIFKGHTHWIYILKYFRARINVKISYSSEKIEQLEKELKVSEEERKECEKKWKGRLLLLCLISDMVECTDVVNSS